MSTVWENTYGCANKYRCDLAVYLMTMLSSSYGIIIYCSMNAPGHGKNDVDGINATVKWYFNGGMELIGKLGSNDTTNIGMLPSASK